MFDKESIFIQLIFKKCINNIDVCIFQYRNSLHSVHPLFDKYWCFNSSVCHLLMDNVYFKHRSKPLIFVIFACQITIFFLYLNYIEPTHKTVKANLTVCAKNSKMYPHNKYIHNPSKMYKSNNAWIFHVNLFSNNHNND